MITHPKSCVDTNGFEGLAKFHFQLPAGEQIEMLTAKAQSLSTDELIAMLKNVGFKGTPRRFLAAGAVSRHDEEELGRFDLLSQFAVVRTLHAEIGKHGESPERLGALARGYAHLGSQSDFLWAPAHKVFYARALLYAERLVQKTGGSPWAYWNRAYVRALVGLHKSALADIALARKHDVKPPNWGLAIEKFCHSDDAALAKLATPESTLPDFLRMLLAAYVSSQQTRQQAAERVLAREPGCMLAFDLLQNEAPLGILRQASGAEIGVFYECLREQLPRLDEIGDQARQLLNKKPRNLAEEMVVRSELIAALNESGRLGRDTGEPSLSALAALIREVSFVHAYRLLKMEKFHLGVDTSDSLAALRPIFKGHPYELFLNIHAFERDDYNRAIVKLLGHVQQMELELSSAPMINLLYGSFKSKVSERKRIVSLGQEMAEQSDRVFPDLARLSRTVSPGKIKAAAGAALRDTSPESSLGVVLAIRYEWDRVQGSAAEWEQKYRDDLLVIKALAGRYVKHKQFEDAERCLKRQIELLPEQTPYRMLAKLYHDHGEELKWMETLEASLNVQSFGLEDTNTHIQLARHFMRHKNWDKALPHVEAAAPAYSAAALYCAADFFELMGDWRRVEMYHQAISERYDDSSLDWFFWCHRTGRGDGPAAREFASSIIKKWEKAKAANRQYAVATFYDLDNQPAEALTAFRAAFARSRVSYYGPHAALLADELGQSELRDRLLAETLATDLKRGKLLSELTRWLQNSLAADSQGELDLALIDSIVGDVKAKESAGPALYLVGKFLANRGRDAEARSYFQRAAASPRISMLEQAMAFHALLKLGVSSRERRGPEFDAQLALAIAFRNQAVDLYAAGKIDQALELYEELLRANPEFLDGYLRRATMHVEREEWEAAAANLSRAHELSPRYAQPLTARGRVYEYAGRYADAIADYEAALKINPNDVASHLELAWIRAACPEQQFRNGAEALKYARKANEQKAAPRSSRLGVLAAACAEAGDFDEAVRHQTELQKLDWGSQREAMQERLKMYQRGEPYHRQRGWWRTSRDKTPMDSTAESSTEDSEENSPEDSDSSDNEPL